MRPYSFPMLRLQFLELTEEDPKIVKAACELALHLIMRHLHLHNGSIAITDEEIAGHLGWTTEKVSRGVKALASSNVFDVRRGRWARATEYTLSDAAWTEATRRRKEAQKIVDIAGKGTPEKSGRFSGKTSSLTQEKPLPLKKKNIEMRQISQNLIETGPHFAPLHSFSLKRWEDCLEECGQPCMNRLFSASSVGGEMGYWFPDEYPAPPKSDKRVSQMRELLSWRDMGASEGTAVGIRS